MGLRKAWEYLSDGIWRTDLSTLRPPRRTLVFLGRAILLAMRGMARDRVNIWAASLTYITLISVIPFVVIAAAASSWFDIPTGLVSWIKTEGPTDLGQTIEDVVTRFQQTDLKALGVISVLVVLYAMVKALTGIEKAFNAIWGVERGRSLGRRLSNYVTVAVVGPLLVMVALSFTASARLGFAQQTLTSLLPYAAMGVLMVLLYWLMPNTHVRLVPALVAAVTASVMWIIVMKTYLTVQVGLSRYSAFYGAYAAVPAFLIWVYVSWIVVLFGTELSYAAQHAKSFDFEKSDTEPSVDWLERSALRVCLLLASRFEKGGGPLAPDVIGSLLGLPARFVNNLLNHLREAGTVSELEGGDYQIAKSPHVLTAADVVNAIRRSGESLPTKHDFPEGSWAAIATVTERSQQPLRVSLAEMLSTPTAEA